ncbi:MAG: hypothetical protein R3F65_13785 [bacterium]
MTVIAWALAALWGLVLLASARHALRGLPPPVAEVPPYALWMPAGGDPPPLEPSPAQTFVGALPQDGPDRLLVLGPDVRVSPELPARLAACGAFVSVFPRPRGGLVRLAVERLLRDFANPPAVVDAAHPAAYADARCAWLRRRDLALPAVGDEPVLRAARARKAHGLPVELRDGHAGDDFRGPPVIAARGLAPAGLRARVADLTAPEPVARASADGRAAAADEPGAVGAVARGRGARPGVARDRARDGGALHDRGARWLRAPARGRRLGADPALALSPPPRHARRRTGRCPRSPPRRRR